MTLIKKIYLKGFKSFAKPIDLVFGNNFNCILGPNGSGKCLAGDSVVHLANGAVVRIDELVNRKLKTNLKTEIEDGLVAAGDATKILTLDIQNYKIISRPIQAYVKRKAPKFLLKIKTRSGKEVKATEYHPLFILNGDKIEPIRADNLKLGIKIAVPRIQPVKEKTKYFFELLYIIRESDSLYVPYSKKFRDVLISIKNRTWKETAELLNLKLDVIKGLLGKQSINFAHLVKILKFARLSDAEIIKLILYVKAKNKSKLYKVLWKNSPKFARLLGYLLAEGRSPPGSNQIWFTNTNEDMVQDYVNLVKQLFEVEPSINEYKKDCWDVLIYSSPIRTLLTKFGMNIGGAENKDITNLFLVHSSDEELGELLNGLYCGDGYVSKSCINFVTKSDKLAEKVEIILSRLGILFIKNKIVKIATNSGFSGVYNQINIYAVNNFAKFSKFVNFVDKAKADKLKLLITKKSNPNLDLIDASRIIKRIVKESGIKIKKIKKDLPRLDSYCYTDTLPSREGVKILVEKLFCNYSKLESVKLLERLAYSDVYWDEVVEIEKVNSDDEWVYDLCVEKDHNFVANGFIVHNSNIMDALCFVLGELSAKSMRAEKSSNLIFNGGKIGSPAREAEVSIHFDNANNEFPVKAPEVKITRIVRQKGLSIYKINNEKRTRQQILDLLSTAKIDIGNHNIVLQGDITRFMEMKPDERRAIIEDIAGISIYDEKKHSALNELEKVETKVKEVTIILTEREAYLRELKKERDQALKFRDYESRIKSNKATFLHIQIKEEAEKKEKIESQIQKNQEEIDKINKKLGSYQEKIEQNKKELENLNKNIEEKSEKEQISLQKSLEEIRTDLVKNTARYEACLQEIEKIKQRKDNLSYSTKEIAQKIKSLEENKLAFIEESEEIKDELMQTASSIKKLKIKASKSAIAEITNFAVNKILSLKKKGVYGTIAQLANVPEKYAKAIEITAGSRANSIIVENDQIAAECIKILKASKAGIATFLPLNKIKPYKLNLSFSNGTPALSVISYDKKYEKAFSYVFGSTLIVDDVAAARKIGIGRARMVTLDGDLFETSGAMIGGFRRNLKINFTFHEYRTNEDIANLQKMESQEDSLKARLIQIQADIKNIDSQIKTIHLPEKEKTSQIIKQHAKELVDFENEVKELDISIKNLKAALQQKQQNEKKFYKDYKNLFTKRNKINEELQKYDRLATAESLKIKDLERRTNEINLRRARVAARLEGLNKEFEEFKGVKIRERVPLEELKNEIYRYEKLLKEMGNVNLKALEVYEDIENEYKELLSKVDKLKTEKADVLKTMEEIDRRKKSIFLKTYKTIAENFKNIFMQLSAKGDAFLELENKEKPLEAGIQIKVRLAGTKFLDIKSLSGGEKTLTALAFIFAIQEFKPASFYLFDEVDAALDKTNSLLLSKFISKYSNKAQYILISHNDQIITEADQIYGVSMQKNGISKVISLKI